MEVEELQTKVKELGLNPLFVPSQYYKVEELPKLGTGKADFKGAKKLAQELNNK
jgi:acyl-[acyl-carrier-protein]-phospholipid O-acyltransferase/long-chain-fatty-acid--[acyl-carrier-protein] ligase